MERGKREIGKLLVYLYRKYMFTGSVFEKVTTANMMFQLAKKSWNNVKWKEFEEKMKLCLGSLSIVKSYEIHLNTCSNPDIYEPRYVLPVIEIKNKKEEVERYPMMKAGLIRRGHCEMNSLRPHSLRKYFKTQFNGCKYTLRICRVYDGGIKHQLT